MKDELREAVRKLRDEVDAKVPEWWAGETIRDRLDAILSSHPPQSEPQGLREAVARWLWNDRDSWKGMLSWEEAPERNVYLAKADSLIVTLTLLAQPSAPADGGLSMSESDLRSGMHEPRELYRKLRVAVMKADESFEKKGDAGTKTWLDDHFLPELAEAGLTIAALSSLPAKPATPEGAQEAGK